MNNNLGELTCPKVGHDNSEIISICCSPECELNTINCLYCLMWDHLECNESMVNVQDIIQGNI